MLFHRSCSTKKRVVSGPINVTRGPSLPVTLLPITAPAPELSHRRPSPCFPDSSVDAVLPTAKLGNANETMVWRPVALLQCCVQGSLYGQLEDLLVFSVNKFLRTQVSLLSEESILREIETRTIGTDTNPTWKNREKTWLRQLRGRFSLILTKRGEEGLKYHTWLQTHECSLMAGFRLIQANLGYITMNLHLLRNHNTVD